jgi:hypothetical protein
VARRGCRDRERCCHLPPLHSVLLSEGYGGSVMAILHDPSALERTEPEPTVFGLSVLI